MDSEGGGISAEALGADSGLVNRIKKFFLQRGHLGIGVMRAERAGSRLFGQRHAQVRGAADTDAYNGWRTGFCASPYDLLEHKSFDAVEAIGRHEHFHERHVFRARTLRHEKDVKGVGLGNEFVMNYRYS